MATRVVCSRCGMPHDLPDSNSWQAVKCACGTTMPVPSLGQFPEAPPSPSKRQADTTPARPCKTSPHLQMLYTLIPVDKALNIIRKAIRNVPITLALLIFTVAAICVFTSGRIILEIISTMRPDDGYTDGWEVVQVFLLAAILVKNVAPLIACFYLWLGRYWARIAMYLVLLYDLIQSLLMITSRYPDQSRFVSILHILIAGSFIYVLSIPATKEYCDNSVLN